MCGLAAPSSASASRHDGDRIVGRERADDFHKIVQHERDASSGVSKIRLCDMQEDGAAGAGNDGRVVEPQNDKQVIKMIIAP